jgi:hypothetical protein
LYRAEFAIGDITGEDRIILDMPGLAGSAEVRLNGVLVDHVLWPPYSADLTPHVKTGVNTVEVEVANTLRNLLGAHYNYGEQTQAGISIASYSGVAGQRKQFMDYGLLSAPQIVIESRQR